MQSSNLAFRLLLFLAVIGALTVQAETIPLWPNGAPGALGKSADDIPTLTLYPAPATGRVPTGIVVCPGGGYVHLAMSYEGNDVAYNLINAGYLDQAIIDATAKDVGVIAMKTAHAVATHHKELQPIPQWRIDKINRVIPGDMKAPLKAYLWVLQNPHISAVNSNLWDETFVRENLSLAGKKVELHPA